MRYYWSRRIGKGNYWRHTTPCSIDCDYVYGICLPQSSLLHLLLGELPISGGRVELSEGSKLSYASQEPWLFTGTVRNNILFGQTYDQKRYREVTKKKNEFTSRLYDAFRQLHEIQQLTLVDTLKFLSNLSIFCLLHSSNVHCYLAHPNLIWFAQLSRW